MTLSYFTKGRDNNFNLIRVVAALAVLVTHSFAIAIGSGNAEPFRDTPGMTIGSIAVDVFFITSGFLVTTSLFARQSTIEFVWARALRIYPALLIMLLLTIFVLGTYFTSISLSAYFQDRHTYIYFAKNSTLIFGEAYILPSVFDTNPYKHAVNGSLWTMPTELRMYAILALSWLTFRITGEFRLRIFKVFIIISALSAGLYVLFTHYNHQDQSQFPKLFFMFFSGAAFYVLRENIILSRGAFWFIIFCLVLAISNNQVFFVVYSTTIAYILFYIAYIPAGRIRLYNKLGDYSYGIYIYAFPVQQAVAALIPGVSVLNMINISGIVTILLAALSWHLLEKRALGLKGHYVTLTKRLLSYRRTL